MKKITAVMIALLSLSLALTGCGDSNSSSKGNKSESTSSENDTVIHEDYDEDFDEEYDEEFDEYYDDEDDEIDETGKNIYDDHYNSKIYGEHVLYECDDFVIRTTDGVLAAKEEIERIEITIPFVFEVKNGFDKKIRMSWSGGFINDVNVDGEISGINFDVDPAKQTSRQGSINISWDSGEKYADIFDNPEVVRADIRLILSADNGKISYPGQCNILTAEDCPETIPLGSGMKLVNSTEITNTYYGGVVGAFKSDDVRLVLARQAKKVPDSWETLRNEATVDIYVDGRRLPLAKYAGFGASLKSGCYDVTYVSVSPDEMQYIEGADEVKIQVSDKVLSYTRRGENGPEGESAGSPETFEFDVTADLVK